MFLVLSSKAAENAAQIAVLPAWWKFAILVAVLLELAGAGYFIKRKWLETQEALPVSVALTLLFMVMSLYFLVGSTLYWTSPANERAPLLMWLVIFLVPICFQYSFNLINAITWHSARRLSAVGVEIPEAPAVTQANFLLREGKIEEAVQMFTEVLVHRARALEEAARWLKAEGYYQKAASLYQEIVDYHTEDRMLWSESVYNLGKLHETFLNQPKRAIVLYKRLMSETPESRFCHLAGADMARLQVMDRGFLATLEGGEEDSTPLADPFHAKRRAMLERKVPPVMDTEESAGNIPAETSGEKPVE